MDLSRGLNRESYYEIEASPRKHRPTPDHQSLRYQKTAKFQRSTHAETNNHRQAIRPKHPNHGPNRKTNAENQSSPYEHHSAANHPPPTTPEISGIPTVGPQHNNQPQHAHPSKPPKPRTKPENGSIKPIQSTQAPINAHPSPPATPQNHRTPTTCKQDQHRPSARQPHNHPNPQTKPEITWQHRNQSSPNRQTSSRHHRCNSGIRRTII